MKSRAYDSFNFKYLPNKNNQKVGFLTFLFMPTLMKLPMHATDVLLKFLIAYRNVWIQNLKSELCR